MNHTPRKRFGQNFLHDPAVLARIGQCIAPKSDQHLIEIGPGQGALTDVLLPQCGKLTAIEIDRDLAVFLRDKYQHQPHFELIEADALHWDPATLLQRSVTSAHSRRGDADGGTTHRRQQRSDADGGGRRRQDPEDDREKQEDLYDSLLEQPTQETFRLVGNLPYNISTPLLFHLFEHADRIQDMHFLLQKEVVDRLVAPPGSKTYGRLSVMAQYEANLENVLFVGPGAFTPAPKVDSALVRIVPKTPEIQVKDKKIFFNIVRDAFGQRRKTVRNALKNQVSATDWDALEINANQRAECLSVNDFVRIANTLANPHAAA